MADNVIPFPHERTLRPGLRLVKPEPVTTQARELGPAAWGFSSREEMERAWHPLNQCDGPEVA